MLEKRKETFKYFDKKFTTFIEYINAQIFYCTNKCISLYEEFKKNDPTNVIFNMDLSETKLDETDFISVSRSLHTLCMMVNTKLSELDISNKKYECIQHDFSTLFCTIYKSYMSLLDATYLINWYKFPENATQHIKEYYSYFNVDLKKLFIQDYNRLYKVFSK